MTVGILATPGPPPPPPLPIPQSVSPWVDVRTHGASIDPTVDSTDAIEAAFARAGQLAARPATSGNPPTAVVKFPAGAYQVRRPIFVPPGVDVWGDGWATRIEMEGTRRLPAFVYGVADPGVVASDRPDLFGILDATAAPRPGVRRGWSTERGLALQGQFTSANVGAWTEAGRSYWEGVECFTLDACLIPPPGGFRPNTPLMGCGRSVVVNDPRPWCLWVGPGGHLVLSLAATTRPLGFATNLRSSAAIAVSFQVSLKDGTAAAWLNGAQVPIIVDGLQPGQTMAGNFDSPLHVGRSGFNVATSSDPPTPLTLAGLRLGTAPRYAVGRPGDPQRKLDGSPVTDHYRYFDRDDQTTTVGFFPFDDPPGQRWLAWTSGVGLNECVLAMRGGQGGDKPQRLADLQVWSRGPCVLLGAVLDWRGDNLRLQSETGAAVGSVPIVMAYPITLNGCTLSGGDAGVSLSSALVAMRDCKIDGMGTDAIRLHGSSLDASNTFAVFVPPWGRTFLRSIPGGEGDVVIRLDRSIVDSEDRGPSVAMIVAAAEPQHPIRLRVTDLSVAMSGPSQSDQRPIVVLAPTTNPAAACTVDGVASGGHGEVVSGGRGWTVVQPQETRSIPSGSSAPQTGAPRTDPTPAR